MNANLIAHSWAEQMYRQRLAEEIAKAQLAASTSHCHAGRERFRLNGEMVETLVRLRVSVWGLMPPKKPQYFAPLSTTGA
jgi:hypothetical protein